MSNRLIIFSVDALVYEDLQELEKKPFFKEILDGGSRVNRMRSIYPTVTYPVHSTLITGTYPEKHGVINNEEFHVGQIASDWNWNRKSIKVEDIFDSAKKAGKTTAAVYWPVTGNHKSIDYLINEYCSLDKKADVHKLFSDAGTSEEVYENVVKKYCDGLDVSTHPGSDIFCINCACEIIRRYKPDVIAIHPANIDGMRHKTGVFSSAVTEELNVVEKQLEQIITATKNAGVFEETNFIILSDHGQMNITRVVNPNVILKEAGLIETDENGKITDWKAYVHSAAMSAQVYLKDTQDKEIEDKVYKLLCSLRDEQVYGIEEVFTAEEIKEKEHLSGDFSFVIETDGFTTFGNDWNRPLVSPLDTTDYKFGHATHGYLPEKGPQPVFIAYGPDIERGVVLENGNVINVASTIVKLFGGSLESSDGQSMDEILKI
ncbi:alkaline phosphatase family protein [uncultured Clostridium sp.]|uniref:alkaline phosphatase family protein n=1 Tax=uncultured Clostridium sp. TaxID=59620 RepID=UPI0025EC5CD4|nr:ectonucleotide pyrophosphatase/phosphodiesterase [uncultured Clostridium sp.]